MNTKIVTAWIIGMFVLTAHSQEFIQSKASYDAAIGSFVHVTTSPPYVKIVVANASTGDEQIICTTANLLAGALHIQHGLSYDLNGRKQAEKIALSNNTHRFIFDEPALRNLPSAFTLDELHEVRKKFSPLSNEELIAGFSPVGGTLQRVFPDRRYRQAIACVLIERGLSPYQADITGQVRVQ